MHRAGNVPGGKGLRGAEIDDERLAIASQRRMQLRWRSEELGIRVAFHRLILVRAVTRATGGLTLRHEVFVAECERCRPSPQSVLDRGGLYAAK
jgi:hypothetical protein